METVKSWWCEVKAYQKRLGTALFKLKKGNALAILFHCALCDDSSYHIHCTERTDSWCRYQRQKANGTNKHGEGLPDLIADFISCTCVRSFGNRMMPIKCPHFANNLCVRKD